MLFYLIIIIATIFIGILTILIWEKTRSIAFLLGLAIIYYYSLLGAWTIIYDELNQRYENYQYLYYKMFNVLLDDNYLLSLLLFSMFIIVIGTVILIFAKPYQDEKNRGFSPFYIRHIIILIISGACLFFSYFIIREEFNQIILLSRSLYFDQMEWTKTIPFYTVSVELNIIAFMATMLGLAVFCSGKNARFLVGVEGWWVGLGYLVLIAGLIIFNFLQGNRGPMVVSGLTFMLFFLVNSGRSRLANTSILGCMLTLAMVVLAIITVTRGMPTTEMPQGTFEETEVVESFLAPLIFSPERFASHFSLYGALSFNVPLIYGYSFVNLAASLVPRILWPDRPDDVYVHYAEYVSAKPGQGYTIHHATGWYLNFGIPGLVLGAIFIGLVWVCLHNLYQNLSVRKSRLLTLGAILMPWIFVGNLPLLLRSGIEGYKDLFFNVILFPTLVFYLALCHKPPNWSK